MLIHPFTRARSTGLGRSNRAMLTLLVGAVALGLLPATSAQAANGHALSARILSDAQLTAALPMPYVARLAPGRWSPGGGAIWDDAAPPSCPVRGNPADSVPVPRARIMVEDGVATPRGDTLGARIYQYPTVSATAAAMVRLTLAWRGCSTRPGVLGVEGTEIGGGTFWMRPTLSGMADGTLLIRRTYSRDAAGTRVVFDESYVVRKVGTALAMGVAWRQNGRASDLSRFRALAVAQATAAAYYRAAR